MFYSVEVRVRYPRNKNAQRLVYNTNADTSKEALIQIVSGASLQTTDDVLSVRIVDESCKLVDILERAKNKGRY